MSFTSTICLDIAEILKIDLSEFSVSMIDENYLARHGCELFYVPFLYLAYKSSSFQVFIHSSIKPRVLGECSNGTEMACKHTDSRTHALIEHEFLNAD